MESAKNCCTLEIFYRALRGEWISVKKIAEEYQVSTKTIGRYINEIQQFLSENRELMQNAELLYSHKEKAYYLHADDFLENKELFALVKVVLGCRCFQKEDLLNLIAKLKRMTTPKDREQFENLIRKELYHEGLMYRYRNRDDFGHPTSAFTICTFWLIQALHEIGDKEEAKEIFDELLSHANHVGLFSEDLDFKTKRLLGNFPQAYSHLALINTARIFEEDDD